MTTKIVLSDLASLTNETSAIATINGNSSTIETASNNFLSRDGTTPNTMLADLDMNGYRILNLPAPLFDTDVLRLEDGSGTGGGGGGGGGSGTVTTVAMTVPSTFSIAGTPITSSGTLALSLNGGGDNTKYLRADNTWAVPATGVASSIAVGTSISGGVSGRILYDNSGAIGEMTTTGSGTVVALATSPTLVTPLLGTPTSGNLLNCVGYPIGSVANLGTGMATFLATPTSANLISTLTDETGTGALVFATSPTLVTPLLGTPTSGTLTNCTGYLVSNLSGFGTGIGTFLATPSSANLASAVTDETGSGLLVFNNSPSFTTPSLGTATSTGLTITSSSADAFDVGRLGSTTPALQVNCNTATCITGIKITAKGTGAGVNIDSIGETNVALTINAAGSGTIAIGTSGTGNIGLGSSGKYVQINSSADTLGLIFPNNGTGLGYTSSGGSTTFSAFANTSEVMRWAQTNITAFATITAQSTLVSNCSRTASATNIQGGTEFWYDVQVSGGTLTLSGATNITSFVPGKTVFGTPTVTSASALTITNAATVLITGNPVAAGSTTITNPYAFYVAAGATYFGAGVGIGVTANAATGTKWLGIAAGATGYSQINFADSVAPTSPNNGDLWFENGTGLKLRSGGSTVTLSGSGGGGGFFVGRTNAALIGTGGSAVYLGASESANAASATEIDHQWAAPRAGTAKNLYGTINGAQPGTGSMVITLRKNGVDQTLTKTIASSSAAGAYGDTSNTVSCAQGDLLSWKIVDNAATTPNNLIISMEYV